MGEIQGQQKVKGVVDIVFLLDVTASMQHCIDALKANIAAFIEVLTTPSANNEHVVKDWRAKVVGYRDYRVDKVPFVDNPFVTDAAQLNQQLNSLVADGGGDEPESLLDALHRLATMGASERGAQAPDPNRWRHRRDAARVVVAFTDASYHAEMSQPKGGTVDDVINAIHAERILLSLFAPQMPCHDTLGEADKSEYQAIPWDSSSKTGAQDALATFTADKENFKKTLEMLAKTVSASAFVERL